MGLPRWQVEAHKAASRIKHPDLDPHDCRTHFPLAAPVQCSYRLLRDALPPAAPWGHHALWGYILLRCTFGCSEAFPDFSPCSGLVGWGLWTRKKGSVFICLYFLN